MSVMAKNLVDHRLDRGVASEHLAALQALAEPNRARIIGLLGHGEHCVCDVGDALGLSTALVSHHLRSLRANGLLRERRAGKWVYYSLDAERIAEVRDALVEMLTPGDAAAASCLCSDCGTPRATYDDDPMTELPRMVETVA
jgi:ArsR family transcriptional regulator, arsenate/arsenite/antimonite-responsive transcriptional repressor